LAAFIGLAIAMGIGRFALTPLLPLLQTKHGLGISGAGWLASANYVGYLFGALVALHVRADGAVLIRAALIGTAAATLAMGFSENFAAWLVLRAAAGFASAFLLINLSAWSLERVGRFPLLRAGVFSGVGGGIVVVGSLCLLLISAVNSAQAWMILGATTLGLTALVWPAFAASEIAERDVARGDHRQHWRLVAAYGATGFGYIIPATFLPVIAKAGTAEPFHIALAWPALGVAAFCSTFVAMAGGGRASALRRWRWAQTIMAFGVGVAAVAPTLAGVLVSGVCVGGTFMVVTMAAMEAGRTFGGASPRRLMAALTTAFAAGQLAGPVVVPFAVAADGDFSLILLMAALTLVAGTVLLPREHRQHIVTLPHSET
jgi:MFS family permease